MVYFVVRGRRPLLVNGRIDGSGRACQRPRTSSSAKCFSCEGALARDLLIFKFLAYLATSFQNSCCAARGHALAIWHRYAAPRSPVGAPRLPAHRPNALRASATHPFLISHCSVVKNTCHFSIKQIENNFF